MIFITLGTQDKQFDRLVKYVEELVNEGKIKDEIVIQSGCTKVSNKALKSFSQLSYDEMLDYFKKADLIITHGGVGSITDALSLCKKVIAVPRVSDYKEAVNNHQVEIIDAFEREGYLRKANSKEELLYEIENMENYKPVKFKINTQNFINSLEEYLERF